MCQQKISSPRLEGSLWIHILFDLSWWKQIILFLFPLYSFSSMKSCHICKYSELKELRQYRRVSDGTEARSYFSSDNTNWGGVLLCRQNLWRMTGNCPAGASSRRKPWARRYYLNIRETKNLRKQMFIRRTKVRKRITQKNNFFFSDSLSGLQIPMTISVIPIMNRADNG